MTTYHNGGWIHGEPTRAYLMTSRDAAPPPDAYPWQIIGFTECIINKSGQCIRGDVEHEELHQQEDTK